MKNNLGEVEYVRNNHFKDAWRKYRLNRKLEIRHTVSLVYMSGFGYEKSSINVKQYKPMTRQMVLKILVALSVNKGRKVLFLHIHPHL